MLKNYPLPFLCLGDSYTIGESVEEPDRWPVQLARLLRGGGFPVSDPVIMAQTGWTTADLQAAIDAAGDQRTYELVSLLIGVNNQYQGLSVEAYRTEFRTLLQTASRYARHRPACVLVLSIPDWGCSPFALDRDPAAIAGEIDLFNAVARDECSRAGATWVYITALTRQATGHAAQFASDSLHYSGEHMGFWAEKALPVVKKVLRQDTRRVTTRP